MNQLWWELYNRECVVCLKNVKSDGADIEKVLCGGAWYRYDKPLLSYIVEFLIYKIYLSVVLVYDTI